MKIKKLYDDVEQVTVRIERKDGVVRTVKLSIPRKEIGLWELIPQVHKLMNAIVEVETAGLAISCQKGCSACCRQLVPLSIPEAFFLRHAISRLDAGKRTGVLRKLRSTIAALERAGLLDDLRRPGKNRQIDVDYFRQGLACPFLENDACGIYALRPFICRSYSVTSPRQACSDPYAHEIEKVEIKRNVGAMLAAFAGHLYGLKIVVPLPLALEWAERFEGLKRLRKPGTWMFARIMDCLRSQSDDDIRIDVHDGERPTKGT